MSASHVWIEDDGARLEVLRDREAHEEREPEDEQVARRVQVHELQVRQAHGGDHAEHGAVHAAHDRLGNRGEERAELPESAEQEHEDGARPARRGGCRRGSGRSRRCSRCRRWCRSRCRRRPPRDSPPPPCRCRGSTVARRDRALPRAGRRRSSRRPTPPSRRGSRRACPPSRRRRTRASPTGTGTGTRTQGAAATAVVETWAGCPSGKTPVAVRTAATPHASRIASMMGKSSNAR